jgi:hypothetical protein
MMDKIAQNQFHWSLPGHFAGFFVVANKYVTSFCAARLKTNGASSGE